MSGLPREVLKWIQSLDLTWQIKTPKWDLSNGYLVAEIFSWYFPREIEMHMYNNGVSLDSKQKNWMLLENFFKRHKFDIPPEYIEGTIHCKEGAAPLLTERMYQILTNRDIRKPPREHPIDFTDRAYQEELPMHARSTASAAVKNNLRITELMADKNFILKQQKAHGIISDHIEYRRQERMENPKRFDRKPTLGERAVRRAPPPSQNDQEGYYDDEEEEGEWIDKEAPVNRPSQKGSNNVSREATVTFKEIQVKQGSRPNTQQQTAILGH